MHMAAAQAYGFAVKRSFYLPFHNRVTKPVVFRRKLDSNYGHSFGNATLVCNSASSEANMEAAVREGRMISPEEANVRKVVGLVSCGWAAYYIYSQGLQAASPAWVFVSIAWAIFASLSGILNFCGCALRLQWSVEGVRLGAPRCPPKYEDFMRGKRRQMLLAFAGSTIVSALATVSMFYFTQPNVDLPALLLTIGKTVAAWLVFIFVWASFSGRGLAHKLGL